jgi:hypothetical protein
MLGCATGLRGAGERELAFRQLQVHEAQVARSQAELTSADICHFGTTHDRDPARSVCEASLALCTLTSELADRDASQRCLRASDACTAAREHGRALCATHAP